MKSQVKSTTTCAALSFWIKVLVLVLLFFLCSLLIASSILATFTTPKFDKEVIRNIAEKAVGLCRPLCTCCPSLLYVLKGLGREEAFHNISKQLQTVYPQLITDSSEWIFINAGGWMGSFYLLHASLTEYVLLFGTAIETSGHSGRYWIDIYDTLIRGTFQQWSEGTTYYVTYSPGDTIYHPRLSATAVRWKVSICYTRCRYLSIGYYVYLYIYLYNRKILGCWNMHMDLFFLPFYLLYPTLYFLH